MLRDGVLWVLGSRTLESKYMWLREGMLWFRLGPILSVVLIRKWGVGMLDVGGTFCCFSCVVGELGEFASGHGSTVTLNPRGPGS